MLTSFVLASIVFVIVAFVLLGVVWPLRRLATKSSYNQDDWSFMFLLAWIFAALSLVVLIISAIPFNSKYWFITSQTSTISSIENKVAVTGSSETTLTTESAIVLEDDNEIVIVSDPRIMTYRAGDTVKLNCSYEWIYGGMDRKICNILE